MARLDTAAAGGRGEVAAALKRPVPELWVGRSTLGPGVERMGMGKRPENSRPGGGQVPRPTHAWATHARRGRSGGD